MGFFSSIFRPLTKITDDIFNIATLGVFGDTNITEDVFKSLGMQGKKKSTPTPTPARQSYSPPSFEFHFPEQPDYPTYDPPPAPVYVPPVDYAGIAQKEALAKANTIKVKKQNALKRGRRGLIATSALGLTDDPVVKKQTLLGA